MSEGVDAGLRVRLAVATDLAALTALRATAGWGSGGLEGSLAAAAAGRQAILVAEWGGQTVGTVTASFVPAATGQPRSGHISDLVVAPRWRRRGIATQLLTAAEEAVQRHGLGAVTLDVDADNDGAMRLYVRRGYRRLGPAQFPWGPGHTMVKLLAVGQGREPLPSGQRMGQVDPWPGGDGPAAGALSLAGRGAPDGRALPVPAWIRWTHRVWRFLAGGGSVLPR